MPAVNAKQLSVYSGKIYAALLGDTTLPALVEGAAGNAAAIRSTLDGLSYLRLASVIDLKINTDMEADLKQVDTDDNGTIARFTTPEVGLEFTLYERDPNAIARILGLPVYATSGGTSNITNETLTAGAWTKGNRYRLANKNADNTIVTAIVVKNGASTLVLNTDYAVYVDTDGYTYVTALTAQATGPLTANYTYSTLASYVTAYTVGSRSVPDVVIRIDAVDPLTSKTRQVYMTGAAINGALTVGFIDPTREGADGPVTTDIKMVQGRGGLFLDFDQISAQ